MSLEDFEQRTATVRLVLKGALWLPFGESTGMERRRQGWKQGGQLEAFIVVKARAFCIWTRVIMVLFWSWS